MGGRGEPLTPHASGSTLFRDLLESFPGGTSGNESASQCRRHQRHGFNPWVGKILWRGAWQPSPVFFDWRIPWTEEPGKLQFMGSQRIKHN